MRVGKELAVTNHAIERLEERMKITGKEIFVVVKKAWHSRQPICEEFLKSEYNMKNEGCTTYHYRKWGGHLFCFQQKFFDVVLLTVFTEDKHYYKNHEAYPKKTIRRYASGSILQEMYQGTYEKVRRSNNSRTRNNLRRKTSEREMGDPPSLREASRRKQLSRPWRYRQEISRMDSLDETIQF